MAQKGDWHSISADEAVGSLRSDLKGLAADEARRRLSEYGYNELVGEERASPLKIFINQFKNLLILILIAAVIVSAFVGHAIEAQVILVIVLFAAVLGFVQEYRAEKALESLKKMAAPTAKVIRDGKEHEIPAKEIVPGDIVLMETGDVVPADLRLIRIVNLKIDESALTGESMPVEKDTHVIDGADIPVGDRKNIAHMGTVVVYGRGKAVAFATGMNTQFGGIAGSLRSVEEKRTPLQKSLDDLSRKLVITALFVVFAIASLGFLRGGEIFEMFIWGVALAVAVVPEALAAIVVITLAVGVKRMARRQALVRKLPAVETLGSTTFICTDKTGTLTQNKMVVREVFINNSLIEVTGEGYTPSGEFHAYGGRVLDPSRDTALQTLLRIAALCNDARLVGEGADWSVKGDPTEGSLLVLAVKGGLNTEALTEEYARVDEIPFSSERRKMTTIHETPSGRQAFAKGAPEAILEMCNRVREYGTEKEMTAEGREMVLRASEEMARKAQRVLAFAFKPLPEQYTTEDVEKNMVFVGLTGLIDPPRSEAKEAVRTCEAAGITVVMITGDHKDTAEAIGRELGIIKKGRTLTGVDLDRTSDEEFEREVEEIEAYARVSPAHKMKVIAALHKNGHVVAMTGDGVNDAPALKKADIGVAMGITGTGVTKEVGDIILLDDNFASMVAAVEEGRIIFGNIKKYLMYLLSSNVGEILLMAIAVLIGFPLPLLAVQILYVNLATDGLPALALSVDPPEPGIMKKPPRDPEKSVLSGDVGRLIAVGGVWSAIVNLAVFTWALDVGKGLDEARSLVFVSLILIQFFKAFNYRSEIHSIFKIGLFNNRWLVLAVVWESLLLLLIIYLPLLQAAFQTYSLPVEDWIVALFASTSIFPVLEGAKAIMRHK